MDTWKLFGSWCDNKVRSCGLFSIHASQCPKGVPCTWLPSFFVRSSDCTARSGECLGVGKVILSGLFAWLIWSVVHIAYLVGFRNRVIVMIGRGPSGCAPRFAAR